MRRIQRSQWLLPVLALVLLQACSRNEATRLQDARRFMGQGDLAAATIEVKTVLQDNPASTEGRLLLGKTLLMSGDPAGAEIELRRAQERGAADNEVLPLLAGALLALNQHQRLIGELGDKQLSDVQAQADLRTQVAIAHLSAGRLDDAEQILKSVIATTDHRPAYDALAKLQAARGDVAAALQMVKQLIDRDPANAAAWALQGEVQMLAARPDREAAITAFQKALSLQPALSTAHVGLLGALFSAGRFDEGRKQLQATKAVLPASLQTQYFEVVLALHDGHAVQARDLMQRLLKASPDNPRLLVLAAEVELSAGSATQAEAHLARSLALVPSAPVPRYRLASLYLDAGRPRKALEVLDPLVTGKTTDSQAQLLAGQAFLADGNLPAAESAFARAAAAMPEDPRVRTGQALAQVARGKVDAGVAALDRVAATDSSALADLPLIRQLMAKRAYPEALAAIDRYAAKVPKLSLPLLLKARVALAQNDRAAARKAMEGALAKDPGYLLALTALAELDIAEGKPDVARSRIKAAADAAPTDAGLQMALADFTGRTGGSKEEVLTLVREAIRLRPTDASIRADAVDFALALGDHSLALSLVQDAAAALPENPLVLDRLGQVKQITGDTRQAISTFDKLAALQPSLAGPQLRLADVKMQSGAFDAALAHARRALALDPASLLAQRVAVMASIRAGKPADARKLVQDIRLQRKGDADSYLIEGEAEMAMAQPDRAVQVLRKAQQLGPSGDGARMLHGALVAARQTADAERQAQAWVKDRPRDLRFLSYLGESASSRNDHPQAEHWFKEVLRIQPANLEALNNLAYSLAQQKKAGAVATAEQAVKLSPNSMPLLDTLAVAYASEGKVKRAIEVQNFVVTSSPDVPEYRFTLAQLQLQAGDKEAARESLVKLSKYGRGFSRHDEVDRLLKQLPG